MQARFKFTLRGEWFTVVGIYGKSANEQFIVSRLIEDAHTTPTELIIQADDEQELFAALARHYLEASAH